MPINGTPDPGSDLVPVVWRGRTVNMDPGDLGSYSLDKAQKEVQSLRNSTHTPGTRGDAEAREFRIYGYISLFFHQLYCLPFFHCYYRTL